MSTAIVYEDKDVIVVHKPSGIATQTARLGQADVESELKNMRHKKGEDNYIGVVHRLDQPVEGLLVFAKTPQAAKTLSHDLQNGKLKKSYHALIPKAMGSEGALEDYLKKNPTTNLSSVVSKETEGGKLAKLTWKYVKTCSVKDTEYDLVEVELLTGRHHQIRAQMSHANMPLLGDAKYGTTESGKISACLGLRQTALLASKLCFEHPVTKKKLEFELPFPKKWCIL